MAGYVDGFVLVVPKNKVAEYKKMAREGARMWKQHGALDYKECMGEDLNPEAPEGVPKALSFTQLAKAKPNETVWFSYIVYKSRQHRDQVNAEVMKEMEGSPDQEMPFDMKRMAFGGFEVAVEI